jgi:hypothetical protein
MKGKGEGEREIGHECGSLLDGARRSAGDLERENV